jgi:PAS domain S-box-containing protein
LYHRTLRQGYIQDSDRITEGRIRAPDGRVGWVEISRFFIRKDDKNFMMVFVRDISKRKELELKAKTLGEVYRTIFENTGTGAIIVEEDTTISMANEGFSKLVGVSKKDIEWHLSWKEFVHPSDLPRMLEYHKRRRIDQTSAPYEYEFKLLDRKGKVHNAIMVIAMIPGTAKSVASIIDITSIREAYENAARLERRTRETLDSISDAFFSLDDNLKITYFNDAAERMLGKKEKEVLGLSIFKAFPVLVGTPFEEGVEKGLQTKSILHILLSLGEGPDQRWYDVRAYPQDRGLSIYIQDVTERRRTEEALRQRTEELDKFFTGSLDLLCIADTDGYFHRLNPEWEKALGYDVKDLEKARFLDFVHPDDVPSTLEVIDALSKQNEVVNFVNRYRAKDGSYRWIEWRSYPSGKLVYAAARDITERKRMQLELEEANAKLGLLTSLTRHDLNNQMMVLRGHLVLAEKGIQNDRQRTHIEKALKASENVSRLLEFSRDYQRLGKDKPVWLNLQEVCTLGIASVDTGKIVVEMDLGDYEVFADAMLEKVFHNFASNSVLHGKTVGRIRVRAEPCGPDLVIVYEDDGVGLDEETRRTMFSPSRGYHGLYLVKGVLDITGMTIEETGSKGKGARFAITVPKGAFRTPNGH